jgi:hypothetical protein
MVRPSLLIAAIAVSLPLLTTHAFANRAAADTCANGLAADAKLIYSATIAEVTPSVDLRELVRSKARGLVMSGKLSRGKAQAAAEAAGACLRQAR